MATVVCRFCNQETNNALAACQHCGEPLKPSGLMAHLKPRSGALPPLPTAKTAKPPVNAPRPNIEAARARAPSETPPVAVEVPHSAVIYFFAEEFFAVQASGERSLIARLFGSSLELHSLCSAMLFAAYAALVEQNMAQLQVAAVTPTGAIIFPIPAQWIKLIFEPLGLPHSDQPPSLEQLLLERAAGRLSSTATQQLFADLIAWHNPSAQMMNTKTQPAALPAWNRHYAEALTGVARQQFSNGRASVRATVAQTEALLNHFYQRHKQVATYLGHEISLITNWIASQQDTQIQQRHRLLSPHGTSPLAVSPAALYDDEYWRTIAQYARRQS